MPEMTYVPADRDAGYLRSRLHKLSWILRAEGVGAFCLAVVRKPVNYWHEHQRLRAGDSFDRAFGLDTGFNDAEEEVFPAIVPETQQGYDPIGVETFRQIMAHLPIAFDEFTFVDLGSGKGRALILASEFPFRKIIGVEYSQHYHEVACQNIDVYQRHSQTGPPIQLVHGDATAFELPAGNTVVFLFNPFQGSTFSQVVRNMEDAVSSHSGNLYVVYAHPVCRRELDAAGRFKILYDHKHRDPYRAFVIYQAAPAA